MPRRRIPVTRDARGYAGHLKIKPFLLPCFDSWVNWGNNKLFFFWRNNLTTSDSGQDSFEKNEKVEFGGNTLVDTFGSSVANIPIDKQAETNTQQRISPMDKEHHNQFD